jgi:putative transcriptional regulator
VTALEFLRKKSGLTLIELGRTIGINSTSLVQVEKENRKAWPKLRKQLAEALEVQEDILFDEFGWPNKITIDFRGE